MTCRKIIIGLISIMILTTWVAAASAQSLSLSVKTLPPDPAATDFDKKMIRLAIELSRQAVKHGNQPFGAVLVKDGKIIGRAENTIFTGKNLSNHAETNVMGWTAYKHGFKSVAGTTLYASTEPCPMCTGAAYENGIAKIVYGLSGSTLDRMINMDIDIDSRKILSAGDHKVEVVGPVLPDEAKAVFLEYFAEQAKKKKK